MVSTHVYRRRRAIAVAALAAVLGVAVLLVVVVGRGGSDGSGDFPVLVPRVDALAGGDPLAYDDVDAARLERDAAFGLSHPLYAKSPGGVFTAAQRTARFRSLIEKAVAGSGFSADIVEAIVFLESGGRPNVIAGDDPARASGLTQILAETGANFLGMKVDLAKSRKLTSSIGKAEKSGREELARELRLVRRTVDERFDPAKALAGTVRYLGIARERLGRDDLAVVSYHMGIGNLTSVLRAYADAGSDVAVPDLVRDRELSWVRVFFDTAPDNNEAAYRVLAPLGDDSPTYYWRVLAAEEIMRLYRDDPARLTELNRLQTAKASAEEALHPPEATEIFSDAGDLERAWESHALQLLPDDPTRLWFSIAPGMGELAVQLGQLG